MKLNQVEIGSIRIALVRQIEVYEGIVANATCEDDKEFWGNELNNSKSAFLKMNDGQSIEEYREVIKNAKS